ncbi:hypothetical protein ACFLWS_02185 [Chloroflexota bacterium]
MHLFRRRSKKKRKKRQATEEQQLRKADLKKKRYEVDSLIELAEKDPAIKLQMLAHTFELKLPDPNEERKGRLKALVDDILIQEIEGNPELASRIARAKLHQYMSAEGLITDSEEGRNRLTPMEKLINDAKQVNELRELMGIKEPGLLEKIFNPEIILALLPLAPLIWGKKEPPAVPEETVSVRIKGVVLNITLSELKRLQREGLLKNAGGEESPGEGISPTVDGKPPGSNTSDKTGGDIEPPQPPEG